ncbi:hypothetical protein V22_23850 [Calycomorphotria hydatis]|uniref:Uncharacterized protein n=1 Tax=Calycomorphotria hydatis TaxID=2528027 RepID=A0A517T9T6_9PLAN|nr:hypothetical protein V22_23850 [Calycomorphotria hydatis]
MKSVYGQGGFVCSRSGHRNLDEVSLTKTGKVLFYLKFLFQFQIKMYVST